MKYHNLRRIYMITVCRSVFKFSLSNRFSKVLPFVSVMAVLLFMSGCAQYAMKKDLTDLQQKAGETDQEFNERLSRIEQAPKADPAVLTSLAERVEKIEKSTLELERRTEPKAEMTLGVKAVSAEDMDGLVRKIGDLDNRIRSINATKKVALKSVSFPLGKVRVEDLSRAELSKLRENAVRIREEKPSTVEIVTWSDSRGTPDKKERVASERARNVASYYRKKAGDAAPLEVLTVFKVATVSGSFWRRADTTMWMTQELK